MSWVKPGARVRIPGLDQDLVVRSVSVINGHAVATGSGWRWWAVELLAAPAPKPGLRSVS
jgi:hypothetical protein